MAARTWLESEVQGPGRRYWFASGGARKRHATSRRRAGYTVLEEGNTAWVSFSKRRTAATLQVAAGYDPLALRK